MSFLKLHEYLILFWYSDLNQSRKVTINDNTSLRVSLKSKSQHANCVEFLRRTFAVMFKIRNSLHQYRSLFSLAESFHCDK